MLTVRYWAAARAAAGVSEEEVAGGAPIGDLIADLSSRHGDRLATVLTRCSFLLDGEQMHESSGLLPSDGVVDVLPPFAGG